MKPPHTSLHSGTIEALRDQLFVVINDHEVAAHDGRACRTERVNAIAYFAHCLGIKPRDLPDVEADMEEYDRRCPCEESRRLEGERN